MSGDSSIHGIYDRVCDGAKSCFPSGGCPTTKPFTTRDELNGLVRSYCDDETGWNGHSKFHEYG